MSRIVNVGGVPTPVPSTVPSGGFAGLGNIGSPESPYEWKPVAVTGGSLMNNTYTIVPKQGRQAAAAVNAALAANPGAALLQQLAAPRPGFGLSAPNARGYAAKLAAEPVVAAEEVGGGVGMGVGVAEIERPRFNIAAERMSLAALPVRLPTGCVSFIPQPVPQTAVGNLLLQDAAAGLGLMPPGDVGPLNIASFWNGGSAMKSMYYATPVAAGLGFGCGCGGGGGGGRLYGSGYPGYGAYGYNFNCGGWC